MAPRRPVLIVLPCLFLLLLLSCRPATDATVGVFYVLTGSGDFAKTDALAQAKPIAFRPWPQQVRVADIHARGGRFFLAVNRYGLAELSAPAGNDDSISIQPRYAEDYFGGRTVTRIFPYKNELYCHVYFDADFPGGTAASIPAERIALLSFSPASSDAGFRPVRMGLPPLTEAWEAVMARPVGPGDLAFEWKRSSPRRTDFRYTAFNLESGRETEKTRAWFYDEVKPAGLSGNERDPVLRALVSVVADSLRREIPDSAVLCAGYDPDSGREARYYFPGNGGAGNAATVYRTVSLETVSGGWLALLPDCRFIIASSQDEKTWERGLLPELPAGFRYTGAAASGGWLCFSLEEVDFYRVGRAGIFLRRR